MGFKCQIGWFSLKLLEFAQKPVGVNAIVFTLIFC